jgi:TrmH family RNA methyltransferase
VITSPRNRRIAEAARLHRRPARNLAGRTLIEGRTLLAEALAAGVPIDVIFTLDPSSAEAAEATGRGIEVLGVTDEVLRRLSGTRNPAGSVAIVAVPDPAPPATQDTVVLSGVGDPGNAGTMVRSAAAFGFQVIATAGTVDLWAPKVLRAGAGAHFRTPIASLPNGAVGAAAVAALESAGLATVALVVEGGEPIDRLSPGPVALMVGDEAHGLDPAVVAGCGYLATIVMSSGTESLNAAVAASIAMWERFRSRR